MALSNSERQNRYRQRLKQAAAGGILALLHVRFKAFPADTGVFIHQRFPELPVVGDSIVLEHDERTLEAVVQSRTFSHLNMPEEQILLTCLGEYSVESEHE